MSEKTAVRTREKWVDNVKVVACILVVLGHFFQSMTLAICGTGESYTVESRHYKCGSSYDFRASY